MRRRDPFPLLFACLIAASAALMVLALTARPSSATVHTSRGGIALVKHFEGFPNGGCPYLDPVGIPTRGYGRIEGITLGSPCITIGQASRELRQLLAARYEPSVRRLFAAPVGVLRGLFNQHRFDSATSFAYNLGVGALSCVQGFESMCRALASRSPRAIGEAMLLYDKADGRALPGLTLRRRAERAMWLRPMGRFELFAPKEVRWVRRYDRLRGHRSARARVVRVSLQLQMAAQADRLRRAIRHDDGLTRRRAVRLAALSRRVHIPIATTGGTP